MTRFSAKEKETLRAAFDYLNPKVWAYGDTATVGLFGGYYFIKKRESGYDYRWCDTGIAEWSTRPVLTHIDNLNQINPR